MQVKLFEVRDSMTFIPCIGIAMNEPASEAERYLLRRSGYEMLDVASGGCVLFGRLDGGKFEYNAYNQPDLPRTMREAHIYILKLWDVLESGDVVDVQHWLKETSAPKVSERMEDR